MNKNIGSTDKVIRIVLGLVIAILGIVFQSWWGLLAVVLIGTALINWCPIWAALGINTNRPEKKKA